MSPSQFNAFRTAPATRWVVAMSAEAPVCDRSKIVFRGLFWNDKRVPFGGGHDVHEGERSGRPRIFFTLGNSPRRIFANTLFESYGMEVIPLF